MRTRHLVLTAGGLAAVPMVAAIPGMGTLLAILGIGFLIFIHEGGHYMACRLTGTRTETFAIGFGPRLFGWESDRAGKRTFTWGKRTLDPADGAMDFRISAIPLGGYVKMAGELPGEVRTGSPDEFPQKSIGQRSFIISAGVIMNLITAVVFYSATYALGRGVMPARIGLPLPGGPAWEAGLMPGDRVLEIGGRRIEGHIDLLTEAALAPRDEPIDFVVERGGKRVGPIAVTAAYDPAVGSMRMQFGVGDAVRLAMGEHSIDVGADQAALVDGARVVGGVEVVDRLFERFTSGQDLVNLTFVDTPTRPWLIPLAPGTDAERRAASEAAPARVGLVAASTVRAQNFRGDPPSGFEVGDEWLAVEGGLDDPPSTEPFARPLGISAWRRTAYAYRPWHAIHVRRGEVEVRIPVSLPTVEARVAFMDGVSFAEVDQGRIAVLSVGARWRGGPGDAWIYRFPSVPAAEAGMVDGDRIVRVGLQDVSTFAEAAASLTKVVAGERIELVVESADGATRTIEVKAVPLEPVGRFDVTPLGAVEPIADVGFFAAIGRGAGRTWREAVNVFRTIGAFVGGRVSFAKNVAGPITIVSVSKDQADRSMLDLLSFLAYISVMLAVLNILPIPILDGGHLAFLLYEKVRGRPLPDAVMFRAQQVGMMLLLILMFFAFRNDIMRLVAGP